jgi:hypothetical protein
MDKYEKLIRDSVAIEGIKAKSNAARHLQRRNGRSTSMLVALAPN